MRETSINTGTLRQLVGSAPLSSNSPILDFHQTRPDQCWSCSLLATSHHHHHLHHHHHRHPCPEAVREEPSPPLHLPHRRALRVPLPAPLPRPQRAHRPLLPRRACIRTRARFLSQLRSSQPRPSRQTPRRHRRHDGRSGRRDPHALPPQRRLLPRRRPGPRRNWSRPRSPPTRARRSATSRRPRRTARPRSA